MDQKQKATNSNLESEQVQIKNFTNDKNSRKPISLTFNSKMNRLNNNLSFSLRLIKNDTREIRDYLNHTQKKIANLDSKLKYAREWKQIALVLDRFLFFLYIIGIAISCISMLL